MLNEDALRAQLTTRLAELEPDVEAELRRVLHRAQARSRRRRTTAGVGLVAAATLLALGLGREWVPRAEGPEPAPRPSEVPLQTLLPFGEYEHPAEVEPGRYRARFVHPPRPGFPDVEIDVPAGWGQDGVDALSTGPGAADSTRRISLVARVLRTQGGVCPGRPVAPGPGTLGLADALASVPGTTSSEPLAVTLDGHEGYFVRLEGPRTSQDLERCSKPGVVLQFYMQPDSWMTFDSPGWTSLLWVLDVEGTPVLINASHGPTVTPAQEDELVEMVESISLTGS